ncbi:MAG: ribosome biogenesis GTPase Der [Gammaproteobacteria bacterium]|nr:ribosome biogenesis GTPase Der [Gammaproteobacteria bacterium]
MTEPLPLPSPPTRKPVIALVGRPNVGKSTLFNRLTRSRDALVANLPGLTRDRQYGEIKLGLWNAIVIDTGGLSGESEGIDLAMAKQTQLAIEESDIILFMVDGHSGLTSADEEITNNLRRLGKPVHLVVNKVDKIGEDAAQSEFFQLGLGESFTIAAAHGRGVRSMLNELEDIHPQLKAASHAEEDNSQLSTRIAFIGRPNVGKSTLINRLLGDERVVAFDKPGTTRDTIEVPFEKDGKHYTLIDTAGVRRRGKVKETVEKFSVIKALQAIDAANVAILIIDAQEGITDQDLHLLAYTIDAGRALVIAVNKWDGLTEEHRDTVKNKLKRRLRFINFAKIHFISALHGSGVGLLFKSINRAHASSMRDMSTAELTRMLEYAVQSHQPPLIQGRRIKLRYAHQGGRNPPVIIIHGNQTDKVPESYRRYLENFFIEALKLEGTSVRIEFKHSTNPYQDKPSQRSANDKRKKNARNRRPQKKRSP